MSMFFGRLVTLALVLSAVPASAGGLCFICKKTSTRQCTEAVYCKSGSGGDTPEDRRRCREAGCDIGGSATCPTGGEAKICLARNDASPWQATVEAETRDGDLARWFR
jgi:hypothetical protein